MYHHIISRLQISQKLGGNFSLCAASIYHCGSVTDDDEEETDQLMEELL